MRKIRKQLRKLRHRRSKRGSRTLRKRLQILLLKRFALHRIRSRRRSSNRRCRHDLLSCSCCAQRLNMASHRLGMRRIHPTSMLNPIQPLITTTHPLRIHRRRQRSLDPIQRLNRFSNTSSKRTPIRRILSSSRNVRTSKFMMQPRQITLRTHHRRRRSEIRRGCVHRLRLSSNLTHPRRILRARTTHRHHRPQPRKHPS